MYCVTMFATNRDHTPLKLFLHFGLYKDYSKLFLLYFLFTQMRKTRKSIAKRFKITGTGKMLRRTPGFRHMLRNKSAKSRRRAGSAKLVAKGQQANLIRALPFA